MSVTIYVPRVGGGTLIIQYTPAPVVVPPINATMLARKGTVTMQARKGNVTFYARKGNATFLGRKL